MHSRRKKKDEALYEAEIKLQSCFYRRFYINVKFLSFLVPSSNITTFGWAKAGLISKHKSRLGIGLSQGMKVAFKDQVSFISPLTLEYAFVSLKTCSRDFKPSFRI